jgi:ABC-2 type transport system permease protein
VPGGLVGYVTGQTVRVCLEVAFSTALVLLPALLLVPGLTDHAGAGGAVAAVGFLALGLLALVPAGFAIGSVFKNPRSVGGWGMLVVAGLVYLSGIFVPMSVLPGWAQAIGQVLPSTWLGAGLRWSLLPESAGVVELGGAFQPFVAVLVLLAWAVVGLALAPRLLRRMARRESGSAVEDRRAKALSRV